MPSDGSTQDTATWPLPAFYFEVIIGLIGVASEDYAFQEVSGIGSQVETEDIMEGGDNTTVYHLPKAVKHSNLVLKRGVAGLNSGLVLWCKSVFDLNLSTLVPQPVLVYLMGESGIPLRSWAFTNAYPVNWKVDAFNSTKNEVAIEEIELCFSTATRVL
jgi:phage tail-like protein